MAWNTPYDTRRKQAAMATPPLVATPTAPAATPTMTITRASSPAMRQLQQRQQQSSSAASAAEALKWGGAPETYQGSFQRTPFKYAGVGIDPNTPKGAMLSAGIRALQQERAAAAEQKQFQAQGLETLRGADKHSEAVYQQALARYGTAGQRGADVVAAMRGDTVDAENALKEIPGTARGERDSALEFGESQWAKADPNLDGWALRESSLMNLSLQKQAQDAENAIMSQAMEMGQKPDGPWVQHQLAMSRQNFARQAQEQTMQTRQREQEMRNAFTANRATSMLQLRQLHDQMVAGADWNSVQGRQQLAEYRGSLEQFGANLTRQIEMESADQARMAAALQAQGATNTAQYLRDMDSFLVPDTALFAAMFTPGQMFPAGIF